MIQHSQVRTNSEWRTFVGRAWHGLCPKCGRGRIFRSRFRLVEQCDACGLLMRREAGAMTGQMYLSAVITEIAAAVMVLAIFFLTDWSPLTSIAVGLPLIVIFSYLVMPRSMALWVAVEFMTDVANRETWTQDEGHTPPER